MRWNIFNPLFVVNTNSKQLTLKYDTVMKNTTPNVWEIYGCKLCFLFNTSIKVINHLIVFTSKENLHYLCLRRYFKPTEYSLGGLTTHLKLERLVTPIYAKNKSLHVQAKLSGQIKYCCMGSYVTLQ